MKIRSFLWVFIVMVCLHACSTKKTKSDIDVLFTPDTLNIGYTYWWPQSGPFIGNCGDELSLVIEGTIVALKEPNNDPGPLYTSQEGSIEIENVFQIKDLAENTYSGEKFMTTDCFDGLDLTLGDKVLVFCHNYEGNYTIAGFKSILKISDFGDGLVASIRKYIDNDQNPIFLKKDMSLWASHGLKEDLQQVIDCNEEMAAISSQGIRVEQNEY